VSQEKPAQKALSKKEKKKREMEELEALLGGTVTTQAEPAKTNPAAEEKPAEGGESAASKKKKKKNKNKKESEAETTIAVAEEAKAEEPVAELTAE
jgi:hypothetical protein